MKDGTKNPQRTSKPWWAAAHLYDFTLMRLPEVEYFESDELRREAFRKIGDEAGSRDPWGLVWGILICAAAALLAMLAVRWGLMSVGLPSEVKRWGLEFGPSVAAIGAFLVVIRWLHRRGFRRALRQKLVEQSVPVCLDCGYLLRGLPIEVQACPECGSAIDATVRQILSSPR